MTSSPTIKLTLSVPLPDSSEMGRKEEKKREAMVTLSHLSELTRALGISKEVLKQENHSVVIDATNDYSVHHFYHLRMQWCS